MLSTNKPTMDKNLKALYDVFKDAANYAFLSSSYSPLDIKIAKTSEDDGIYEPEAQRMINEHDTKFKTETKLLNSISNKYNEKAVETAKKFAEEFVEQLKKGKVLETISDEIDSHVKAIADGLMITMMPQGIATIIAPPSGPCTGSMVISSSTAQINLL